MKLYSKSALLALALAKHGSAEGIAEAVAKRGAKAAKAAATRAHNDGWRQGANPATWTPESHRSFTQPFKASIRCFLLCAARLACFGGAAQHAALVQRIVQLVVESPDVKTLKKHEAKPARALKAPRRRYDRYAARGRDYEYGDSDDDAGYDSEY